MSKKRSFYQSTLDTYSDPEAVEAYVRRIPTTRAEGLSSSMRAFAEVLPAGGRVLDVGCGPGADVAALARLGFESRGIDASPLMVELARSKYGERFQVGDTRKLRSLALGTFDGVVCIAVLLHILRKDAPAVVGQIREVTRDGGALLLVTKEGRNSHWDCQLGFNKPRGVVLYSERQLKRLLGSVGFRVEAVFRNTTVRNGIADNWISLVAVADLNQAPKANRQE